jgi:hypothetical protein
MTRQEMEKIWQRPGVGQAGFLCVWGPHHHPRWKAFPGTPCNLSPGRAVLKFRERLARNDFPPWSKTQPPDMTPSKELCERYKKDCPRNYKALIAAFGKTETRYDDPRQFHYQKKELHK